MSAGLLIGGGQPQITMPGGGVAAPLTAGVPWDVQYSASTAMGTANTNAYAGIQESQISSDAAKFSAKQQAMAQMAAAQAQADASRYASNQQLAGTQAQLAYKQGIFNTVYGRLGGMLGSTDSPGGIGSIAPPAGYAANVSQLLGGWGGGWGGGGGGGGFGYGGGAGLSAPPPAAYTPNTSASDRTMDQLTQAMGNKPNIPQFQAPTFQQANLLNPQDMPVISQDLLNQQISNAYAQNQQMTQTAIRGQQSAMGGKGLGAASPAARAIAAQLEGSRIGSSAQAAMGLQQNAAGLNAQYAQAMNQALIQQAASVYGTQMQGATTAYGTDVGALTGMYGTDVGALQSALGSQLGYEGQMGSAAQAAQASMYGNYQQALASQYATNVGGATSIYGTNVGYQQALQAAQLQAQTSQRNAILQALAGLANA